MTRKHIFITIFLTILVNTIEITDITDGENVDSLVMDEFWDRSSLPITYESKKSVIRLTEEKYKELIVDIDGKFIADRPWYVFFAHLKDDRCM